MRLIDIENRFTKPDYELAAHFLQDGKLHHGSVGLQVRPAARNPVKRTCLALMGVWNEHRLDQKRLAEAGRHAVARRVVVSTPLQLMSGAAAAGTLTVMLE
jgi:hypothetical protein